MMVNANKLFTTIAAGICLAAFSACKDSAPQASAELEVAEVKGIRFDEPVPQVEAALSEAPTTLEGAGTDTAASVESPVVPATAEDVPENIAMIPTATPVPTPAETPEPAKPEVASAAPAAPPAEPGSYEEVSFKVLSGYKYEEPIPSEGEKPEDVEKRRQSDQIPAEVKSLDGKNAIVQGWMVPMEISEDGAVKSFVLVKTQPECCFGDMQAMNEWVDVIMEPGKSAEFNVDQPVKVYGQLDVGEKVEDGFVLSIYRMKAERVEL